MRKPAALFVVVVALASCSSAGKPHSAPPGPACSSFIGHNGVTVAMLSRPCTLDAVTAAQVHRAPGEQYVTGIAHVRCKDGREMMFNPLGWGYDGEWFAAFLPADGQGVPPADAMKRCGGTTP